MNPGIRGPHRMLLVGAGGLVGRHLARVARAGGVAVRTVSVPWGEPAQSEVALGGALAAHLQECAAQEAPWSIVWAAGAGVVATSAQDLETEVAVFASFTEQLVRNPLPPGGAFLLVSSAGGVHAGSEHPPFTEASTPVALSPYGKAKLRMEDAARAACAAAELPLLIARLANVYGPGQRLRKPQGLISQIALTQLSGHPLRVTVSQDTLRDYVYVVDAARLLVAGLDRLGELRPAEAVVKIVATGHPVSVGHLIGEARRVLHRPLRTVSAAGSAAGQVADLRLRSIVWTDLDASLRTPLPAGLAATVRDVLRRVSAGGDVDAVR